MARKLVQLAALVCDECDKHGIHDVDADTSHVISIDGGPPKRFDFCSRSERAVQFLLDLYESHGVDVTTEEKKPARKKPAKAVTQKQVRELTTRPEDDTEPSLATSTENKVWCPLPHGKRGTGKAIAYRQRPAHAERHGLHIWDIEWKDLDGQHLLREPCTFHAECLKTGLSYTNAHGVDLHVQKCPLPRIDQPTNEASP